MKVGQLIKTKQGVVGIVVRRFLLDGKIYCQIQIKNRKYEYRVFEEKDLISL